MHPNKLLEVIALLIICIVSPRGFGSEDYRMIVPMQGSSHLSCGVDCLCVLVSYVTGSVISVNDIRAEVPVGRAGSSSADMQVAAKKLGVPLVMRQMDYRSLIMNNRPAILHVNNNHYILFLSTERNGIAVFDNQSGLFHCSEEWFRRTYSWKGSAMIVDLPWFARYVEVILFSFGIGIAIDLILLLRTSRTLAQPLPSQADAA